MGRAKLAMEYIKKEKTRNLTFEKRRKGLKKKAHELATLCGVPVGVVIYQSPNSEPDIFPQNQEEVRSIIGRYASGGDNGRRGVGLQDVVEGKKRKKNRADAAVEQCHEDPLNWLDGLGRDDLMRFGSVLEYKLAAVHDRIGELKRRRFVQLGGFEGSDQCPMISDFGFSCFGQDGLVVDDFGFDGGAGGCDLALQPLYDGVAGFDHTSYVL